MGCGVRSHKADCLCDVDVSKTKDIKWDNPPPQFAGVETVEDVIRMGATTWLRYDVDKLGWPGIGLSLHRREPEEVAQIIAAVKERVGYKAVVETFGTMDQWEYNFILKALDMNRAPKPVPIPIKRVLELHATGLSPTGIGRQLAPELRRNVDPGQVSEMIRNQGLKPHRDPHAVGSRQGRPMGWRPGCGMTYAEFRAKESEAVA